MLRPLDPNKIERHGETHILDFLRTVTRPEGGSRYGKRDLVLHLADAADSPVAVVLEVKGPKNPGEMPTLLPTLTRPKRPSMPPWPPYMAWLCRR